MVQEIPRFTAEEHCRVSNWGLRLRVQRSGLSRVGSFGITGRKVWSFECMVRSLGEGLGVLSLEFKAYVEPSV